MSTDNNPKSVPVKDVMAASGAMLQKQLLAILVSPVDGLGPIFANIEEHLKHQVELECEGVMFAAGPLWTDDEESWEGEGLVVARAESREGAIAIAERDPMHVSGARSFRVRPWLINEGTLSLRLDFSTQKFTLA
ncbi:YciI family protein [Hoeflea sp. CAU 1731]